MKKHFGIKLSLLGIGLIAFFPYAESFMNVPNQTFFGSVIAGFGAFSPLIGLVLCIAGLFVKNNESDLNNTSEFNADFYKNTFTDSDNNSKK